MNYLTKTLAAVSVATGSVLLSSGPAMASVAGGILANTTPAVADPVPLPEANWREVPDAPRTCSTVREHSKKRGVRFRICVIANSRNEAQAMLVVVNNSNDMIAMDGRALQSWGGSVACASTNLNKGFQRACLGKTELLSVSNNSARGELYVNWGDPDVLTHRLPG